MYYNSNLCLDWWQVKRKYRIVISLITDISLSSKIPKNFLVAVLIPSQYHILICSSNLLMIENQSIIVTKTTFIKKQNEQLK